MAYLGDVNATDDRTPVDHIETIWVASDDSESVDEVRALVSSYFPSVTEDNIVWISGVAEPMATHSIEEVRKSVSNHCTGAGALLWELSPRSMRAIDAQTFSDQQ